MAVTHQPIFIQASNNFSVTLVNADGTTAKTTFTAGANGSRIDAISVTSDDTADMVVKLYVNRSGVDYLLGEATVVDGAGTNGTDKVKSLLNATDFPFLPTDGNNKPYLALKSGETLKVAAKVAVTSAKTLTVSVFGGDY